MVPGLGFSAGGARIWVSVGPINFQPGEFAKLALAVFFAGYLADNRELIAARTWRVGPLHLPEPRYLLPIVAAWAFAVVVMVGQRDLGSSLLFFALFVVMLWVATERPGLPVLGLVLFASRGLRVAGGSSATSRPGCRSGSTRGRTRSTAGYQIVQALYGLTDGGLAGTGLGLGSPGQVPEAQNDFIFTAIGEELGLFGGTALLIAYLLLIGGGLRIALRTDNTFEKLLATGLTTIVGVQAFIIIGGVIKLVPLTGITLPFVSYGGSSLVSNYILLALLIRLSDSGARRRHELPDDPTPASAGRPGGCGGARRPERRRDHARASERQRASGCQRPAWPGNAMNRQIRQLAGGLMACYVALFVTLNYWQVGRKEELNARIDNTRAIRREFEDLAARSSPPTASSSPSPSRTRPAATSPTSASTRPATCSPTSPATTRSPSARPSSSAPRTPCSPARPASSSCATSPG